MTFQKKIGLKPWDGGSTKELKKKNRKGEKLRIAKHKPDRQLGMPKKSMAATYRLTAHKTPLKAQMEGPGVR